MYDSNKAFKIFTSLNMRHNNDKIIKYIFNIFSKFFDISASSCDSFVKNILLAQEIRGYEANKKRTFAFVPFLFIELFKNLFKKNNMIKSDIVFDNSISRWVEVNNIVSNQLQTINVYKYTDKVYNTKAVLKMLFFLFKYFYLFLLVLYISIKYKVNYIAHCNRLLLEILENESILKHVKSNIYFTSNMDSCTFVKKEQFNKAGMKVFLLQVVAIDYYISSYIASNVFFSFGKNQVDIALRVGSEFDKIYNIGSIKSIEKSKKTFDKYDIVFIEQIADLDKIHYTSNAEYKNLVNNLIRFSKEHPEVSIAFLSRIQDRYFSHDEIIDRHFKCLYENLDGSDIKMVYSENNYPLVKEAGLVISYCSTLCFEAIGVNSLVLFCFNNSVNNYELLYNTEDECILFESNYEAFKRRVLYMLNIDKETKNSLVENMKRRHMSTSSKSLDTILLSINNYIANQKGKA